MNKPSIYTEFHQFKELPLFPAQENHVIEDCTPSLLSGLAYEKAIIPAHAYEHPENPVHNPVKYNPPRKSHHRHTPEAVNAMILEGRG